MIYQSQKKKTENLSSIKRIEYVARGINISGNFECQKDFVDLGLVRALE